MADAPRTRTAQPIWLRDTPLNRIAEVKDVHGAVVYLASEASDFVTGHDLVVDGGGRETRRLWSRGPLEPFAISLPRSPLGRCGVGSKEAPVWCCWGLRGGGAGAPKRAPGMDHRRDAARYASRQRFPARLTRSSRAGSSGESANPSGCGGAP